MNAQIVNNCQEIPKEKVAYLSFPTSEVLNSPDEIRLRRFNAQQGLLLGNTVKGKVKIVFEDKESVKQVLTTIWGLTDMHVILKYGLTIPLNRIYSIDACP